MKFHGTYVNITLEKTEYYFGDIPTTVATLKDHILIYRRKLKPSRFKLYVAGAH